MWIKVFKKIINFILVYLDFYKRFPQWYDSHSLYEHLFIDFFWMIWTWIDFINFELVRKAPWWKSETEYIF